MSIRILSALVVVMLAANAHAAVLTPTSYDMINGGTGSYNYWDDSYNGSGNNQQNYAALSGGLGDLTDGYIATQNWNYVEGPDKGPHGPYVGWDNGHDPTITFHFAGTINIETIRLYVDDSDGYGGVDPPEDVVVTISGPGGGTFYFDDPEGPEPFAINLTNLDLTCDAVDITLHRQNAWVFLSEVEFDGTVPEPATVLIWGALGLIGLACRRFGR